MERLTIKELAPYLPYGVLGMDKRGVIYELGVEPTFAMQPQVRDCYSFIAYNIKPLLRPLSSLTEEIEHNGERFVPKDKIHNYTKVDENGTLYVLVDGTQWQSNPLRWGYETVNWLISLHFDVFGLIDRGLALPIDGKEVEGE